MIREKHAIGNHASMRDDDYDDAGFQPAVTSKSKSHASRRGQNGHNHDAVGGGSVGLGRGQRPIVKKYQQPSAAPWANNTTWCKPKVERTIRTPASTQMAAVGVPSCHDVVTGDVASVSNTLRAGVTEATIDQVSRDNHPYDGHSSNSLNDYGTQNPKHQGQENETHFMAQVKSCSVSTLLADYGEHDPDWQKIVPINESATTVNPRPLSESPVPRPITPKPIDFSRQPPLSALLEEYGDYDPDWQKANHDIQLSSTPVAPLTPHDANEANSAFPSHDAAKPVAISSSPSAPTSMLGTHGTAPIHVEIVSFAYQHGIPGEIRKSAISNHHYLGDDGVVSRGGGDGIGYALPLGIVPIDCRTFLPPLPSFVSWQDGLSGYVKRLVLESSILDETSKLVATTGIDAHARSSAEPESTRDTRGRFHHGRHHQRTSHHRHNTSTTPSLSVRTWTQVHLVAPLALALRDAMVVGGHGYASPLKMRVYLGSDQGRHRAVVVAELVATALRQRLRQNCREMTTTSTNGNETAAATDLRNNSSQGMFPVPCSVGTYHRELVKERSGRSGSGKSNHQRSSGNPPSHRSKPSSSKPSFAKQNALEERH